MATPAAGASLFDFVELVAALTTESEAAGLAIAGAATKAATAAAASSFPIRIIFTP
jgi:hypothetical protein